MQIIVQPASFNVESGPLPNILIGGSGMAGLVVNGVTMSGYVPVTGAGITTVFQQGGTLYISGSGGGGGGGNGNLTGIQTSSGQTLGGATILNGNTVVNGNTLLNGNITNMTNGIAVNESVAFGPNSVASGVYSFAVGNAARALGGNSFAFGNDAVASAAYSYAFGAIATAEGAGSFAFGSSAIAQNTDSWVINLSTTPLATPYDTNANQWVSYFSGGYYFDGSPLYAQTVYVSGVPTLLTTGNQYIGGNNIIYLNGATNVFQIDPQNSAGIIFGGSTTYGLYLSPGNDAASFYDWNTKPSIDLVNRLAYDENGSGAIDWNNRILSGNWAVQMPSVTVTGNFTGSARLTLVGVSNHSITGTMPDATTVSGYQFTIKNYSGSAGTIPITITGTNHQTFDGSPSYSLNVSFGSVTLVSANGNWWLI